MCKITGRMYFLHAAGFRDNDNQKCPLLMCVHVGHAVRVKTSCVAEDNIIYETECDCIIVVLMTGRVTMQ
jgi:hypothetical protein